MRKKPTRYINKQILNSGRFRIQKGCIDGDEAFMKKKCAEYFLRIIDDLPRFDSYGLDFVVWILGEDSIDIFNFLLTNMNARVKKAVKEEFDGDGDDFADMLGNCIKYCTKREMNILLSFIKKVIKKRIVYLTRTTPSNFEQKICSFRDMFRLTLQETEFCIFIFIMKMYKAAERFFDDELSCDRYSGRKYLIKILDISPHELDSILSGTLVKIGLIDVCMFGISLEEDFIAFFGNLSEDLLIKKFYRPLNKEAIPLEYHLVEPEYTEHLLRLLKHKGPTATHVLLYGPPGTGKSPYAHGLARALGIPAYEIIKTDEANSSSKRRAGLIACINMTSAGEGALVIVDEADNMLNTESSWAFRGETQDKGWLNCVMEEPGARVIWITNRIENIDESVMRRFAFSLHFKQFGIRQRMRLWETVLQAAKCPFLLASEQLEQLANQYDVSAGAIDLAVKKALETAPQNTEDFLRAVHFGLEAHRTLTNNGIRPVDKQNIEKCYSIEGLNIDKDISIVMSQLEAYCRYLHTEKENAKVTMSLLLYGPPGTGKSEFARYVARQLGKELMVKVGSDLISMWIGETERNIARAFADAESRDAVLVIDEADSFIFSREAAVRSWEISCVNEFLTQMERFRGILICTTNRFQNIDAASVRRFNHKILFNFLDPEGVVVFYQRLLAGLVQSPVDAAVLDKLRSMRDLAPDDFKIVRDRCCLMPASDITHDLLIAELENEVNVKRMQSSRKILGF